MTEIIAEARDVKGCPVGFIFMVGGFSESPFLKNEIKAAFENQDGENPI